MGSLNYLNGPGKTSPRLINDLLDYDLQHPPRDRRNLLADPAPQFNGAPIIRRRPSDCHHSLMRKDPQTIDPSLLDEGFEGDNQWMVAAYCLTCRYHFTIAAIGRHSGSECQLSNQNNPLHHFVRTQSEDAEEYSRRHADEDAQARHIQVAECHQFMCSSQECGLQLEIKISYPRLSSSLLSLILDVPTIFARGQREIARQPERYGNLGPLNPFNALFYLRSYLRDAYSDSESKPDNIRKIARRNKKYMLAYGEECNALFEYLSFVPIQEENSELEGEYNYFWRLPLINKTNKDFFDDVVVELETLMSNRPPTELTAAHSSTLTFRPVPALQYIERYLGYFDYPKRSRLVDLSHEEHPHYASLGAVDDFDDQYLSWAYDRQCDCDPPNKPYYLDCLADIATGRQSSDLQMKVVMATSAGEYGLKAITEAYGFFRLDPNTKERDEHIIGIYNSRILSAPRQKDEARSCLRIIAIARGSAQIEAVANDKAMTLEEAFEFLSVTGDTASDSIGAVAVAMAEDADKGRLVAALRVIAEHRNNDFGLLDAASTIEAGSGGFMLDIREAYSRLQVSNHSASDDMVFNYFTSLSSGAAPGSKESYTQALRTIAHDRQSAYLLRKLDDPNADIQAEPGNADQPVGLDNIGNTCYLNSLLQYFYTIKPVRDVVMNIEEYRMALTEDDLRKKRAGGRQVTKVEVIKGQRFMDEMHHLFENLKTASTRSIKPTVELAELSFFSADLIETIRRQSVASPQGAPSIMSIMNGPVFGPEGPPPPMPTRPSPAVIEEDIEMIEDPQDTNLESGSVSSDSTLVDMGTPVTSKEPEAKLGVQNPNVVNGEGEDAVMENGDIPSPTGLPPPENPPPVPPRNKSGLVIQTTESHDRVPDDVRWKMGTQQDVDEVIRNTTFRMMCAIKPTTTDPETGEQTDQIRDTFYGDNATYLDKTSKLERKVESWSSLLVYATKSRTIDIYQALDTVFDEQSVEVDEMTVPQYTSIHRLPPILQIQINRTDYDKRLGVTYKIKDAVDFPETIYLDRYMDSGEPDSLLMRRRRQGWQWKAELRILEERLAALQNGGTTTASEPQFPATRNYAKPAEANINVADALLSTKDYIDSLQEEEIDGMEVDPTLSDQLEGRISELSMELERISGRVASLKQKLAEQFTDMRKFEYKLQAVFIHRGEAGGGHYWIYIYDFKNDIWREYNDEYVTIVRDRKKVFDHHDGSSGTPYYLVYVRSSDRDDLVDPVCRDVQDVQDIEMDTRAGAGSGTGTGMGMGLGAVSAWNAQVDDEAISMEDAGDDTRHIEHANPRPILPKPSINPVDGWVDDGWDGSAIGHEKPW